MRPARLGSGGPYVIKVLLAPPSHGRQAMTERQLALEREHADPSVDNSGHVPDDEDTAGAGRRRGQRLVHVPHIGHADARA